MTDFQAWWRVASPYVLVVLLALTWALVELLQTFSGDEGRALRTRWAVLYVATNALFAFIAFALVQMALPEQANPILTAFGVGVGWQALLRTRIHFLQPLGPQVGDPATLSSLADLYGRFQQYCRTRINQAIVGERVRLLEKATLIPLEKLIEHLQLLILVSMPRKKGRLENIDAYLEKIAERYNQTRQAQLVASLILFEEGYTSFDQWIRKQEKTD